MRIKILKFSKQVGLPNYGHEKFEATAELEKGENPDLAFMDLKKYVEEKLRTKVVEGSRNEKGFHNRIPIQNETQSAPAAVSP